VGEALTVALLKTIAALSLVVSTMMGAVLAAEKLYDGAVAQCQTLGGTPVAVENRLAYDCATPYGRISP